MQALVERIKARTRKRQLGARPLFRSYTAVSSSEIERIELNVGVKLPEDLKSWLLAVGYGDVDEVLSFRFEWMRRIEEGPPSMRGVVTFAQDDLGNYYAFSPSNGGIVYLARRAMEFATVAPSFRAFMEELERRDFKLREWMSEVETVPYA